MPKTKSDIWHPQTMLPWSRLESENQFMARIAGTVDQSTSRLFRLYCLGRSSQYRDTHPAVVPVVRPNRKFDRVRKLKASWFWSVKLTGLDTQILFYRERYISPPMLAAQRPDSRPVRRWWDSLSDFATPCVCTRHWITGPRSHSKTNLRVSACIIPPISQLPISANLGTLQYNLDHGSEFI